MRKYLKKRNGFFVELGANDGVRQSNTLWFEKNLDWHGILIEPITEVYQQCVRNRPNSRCFNCACVSNDYNKKVLKMHFADLMTIPDDEEEGLSKRVRTHLNNAKKHSNKPQYIVEVPSRTLSDILEESNVKDIDFFSLDVEGYELNVLKGLDFSRWMPCYILIEVHKKDEAAIFDFMHDKGYIFVRNLSDPEGSDHYDSLFRAS